MTPLLLMSVFQQVTPSFTIPELFAVHLPLQPVTTVGGGAKVREGFTTCKIEPHGITGFSEDSVNVIVDESRGNNVCNIVNFILICFKKIFLMFSSILSL